MLLVREQRDMDKGDKQRERKEESERVKMSVAAATAPETRIQRKLQVAAVKQGIRGNKVSTENWVGTYKDNHL